MDYCKSNNDCPSVKNKKIVSFFSRACLFLFTGYILCYPFFVSAVVVDISATVPGCGDGNIVNPEQCDGIDLAGESCVSRGFAGGGNLSCTAACTFNTTACNGAVIGGGGGGGGGGGSDSGLFATRVVFTGRAYPLSKVILLQDGRRVVSTIAGPDSRFDISLQALPTGNYTFSLYAEDAQQVRSDLFSFSVYITSGATTKVGGIFLAPTISLNKTGIQRGETLQIFGQSVPHSEITISVHSDPELFLKTTTDEKGIYLYQLDTSVLAFGEHHTKAKSISGTEASSFSRRLRFVVGNETIVLPNEYITQGDISGDGAVNIIDFSILAYWYHRPNPPKSIDLNNDGKIDLVDFSRMAFYWTG